MFSASCSCCFFESFSNLKINVVFLAFLLGVILGSSLFMYTDGARRFKYKSSLDVFGGNRTTTLLSRFTKFTFSILNISDKKKQKKWTQHRTAAEFLTFRFSFSCITHAFFFSFCLGVCEYEKLEALFLKLHEDLNDSFSNVHVPYKTAEFLVFTFCF